MLSHWKSNKCKHSGDTEIDAGFRFVFDLQTPSDTTKRLCIPKCSQTPRARVRKICRGASQVVSENAGSVGRDEVDGPSIASHATSKNQIIGVESRSFNQNGGCPNTATVDAEDIHLSGPYLARNTIYAKACWVHGSS